MNHSTLCIGCCVLFASGVCAAQGNPRILAEDYPEAMNVVSREVAAMAKKRGGVLCVWLFDESESMKDDQHAVQQNLPKFFASLEKRGAARGRVASVVASFGQRLHVHSAKGPLLDVQDVQRQVRRIPVDDSGIENMCQAIGVTVKRYEKLCAEQERQMALLLVTDESGDRKTNVELLEPAVTAARAAGCRIFVLGREAVFASPYAYFRWRDPRTKIIHRLRIDRGPESPFVEQLQTDGFQPRRDVQPSGFGPYEQVRLAHETGGAFIMLPSEAPGLAPPRRGDDGQRLRAYPPSLASRAEYVRARNQSPLRSTLWSVIASLNPHDPEQGKRLRIRLRSAIDVERRDKQMRSELAKAEQYADLLFAAAAALDRVRPQRAKENARWRANFDLAHAELAAFRIRVAQYRLALARFLDDPKQPEDKPPQPRKTLTQWEVVPRKQVAAPGGEEQRVGKEIQRAEKLLKQVAADHPGTPWSARAQRELSRGFGVEIRQRWDYPPLRPVLQPRF